jgi:hypothetical protein
MREIRFAEQVYTQAVTERDAAFAQELEATPTVVVQDPLPVTLPKVRKKIVLKTAIAALVSVVLFALAAIIADVMKRRLERRDAESERFRGALPRLRGSRKAVS